MDKRTLWAIILSVVVIGASYFAREFFFPPQVITPLPPVSSGNNEATLDPEIAIRSLEEPAKTEEDALAAQYFVLENDVLKVTISNHGGVAESILLKKHTIQDPLDASIRHPIEMVNQNKGDSRAFEISLGNFQERPVLKNTMKVESATEQEIVLSRTYIGMDEVPYVLRRSYRVFPGSEYIIEVGVELESLSANAIPLPTRGSFVYTLTYGPQIGPDFEKLDGQTEYRKYYRFFNGSRDEVGLSNETKYHEDTLKWAGFVGKYFAVAGIPDNTVYQTVLSNRKLRGTDEPSYLAFSRPPLKSSVTKDVFKFYVGPKDDRILIRYNDRANNSSELGGAQLNKLVDDNILLGWLEYILKLGMELFYNLTGNWGISIIILTVLSKLILFPLTQKSFESTAAMQKVQPKIAELQAKYKNDAQQLNARTMELYKKEGVNPLGGCLPMLLQLPIFFALYGMFSNHFDLRGALFIEGWITDLSLPESIFQLPFSIPFVNISHLRALPILMLVSQMATTLLNKTPTQGPAAQAKLMSYGMPILFFFILYNMPSGLLIYWTLSNVLSAAQQWYISQKKSSPKRSK